MNDRDVAVLHCQVESSLLVLRAKIFFSTKSVQIIYCCFKRCILAPYMSHFYFTIKTFQKECNTLTKLVFSYLIPEVWISFVLQEKLDKRCVSYLRNWV